MSLLPLSVPPLSLRLAARMTKVGDLEESYGREAAEPEVQRPGPGPLSEEEREETEKLSEGIDRDTEQWKRGARRAKAKSTFRSSHASHRFDKQRAVLTKGSGERSDEDCMIMIGKIYSNLSAFTFENIEHIRKVETNHCFKVRISAELELTYHPCCERITPPERNTPPQLLYRIFLYKLL